MMTKLKPDMTVALRAQITADGRRVRVCGGLEVPLDHVDVMFDIPADPAHPCVIILGSPEASAEIEAEIRQCQNIQ